MQAGQAAPRRPSLAQTAMNPLARAYQLYQQYVGEPFQQAVRGGVRGYFGLPMMSDASTLGREAYRQGEALGFTPGVGMPAGAVRVAAEGMQALPSIAGDIGRVIGGLPSGAAARQAKDFAAYQRSIPPSDVSRMTESNTPSIVFDDTLMKLAVRDSSSATGLIDNALQTDVQGVIPGRLKQLDKDLAQGLYTEEDVKQAFASTLNQIRSKFGNTVKLWRADAPAKEKNSDARTVFMADEATARQYEKGGREAKPYIINTDDILGVYARPSGYREVIVRSSALNKRREIQPD
jgi:hypothetical protein